jgi:hypothetical protein
MFITANPGAAQTIDESEGIETASSLPSALITATSGTAQTIDESAEIETALSSLQTPSSPFEQPSLLEELMAVAQASRFYNEEMLETCLPESRRKNRINSVIERYNFIIVKLEKIIKGEDDYKKLYCLYVVLQNWFGTIEFKSKDAQSKGKLFTQKENSFIKEMINIIEKENIPNEYRKAHSIFKFEKELKDGKETYITFIDPPKFYILAKKSLEELTRKYDSYLDLLEDKNKKEKNNKKQNKTFKEVQEERLEKYNSKVVSANDFLDETEAYIKENMVRLCEISKKYTDIFEKYVPSDCGDTESLFLFIEQFAPVLYDSSKEWIQIHKTAGDLLGIFNFNIKEFNVINSGIEEHRKQLIQEKKEAFIEEQRRLKHEYEESREKKLIEEAEKKQEEEAKKTSLEPQTMQEMSGDSEPLDGEQSTDLPRVKVKTTGDSDQDKGATKRAAAKKMNEAISHTDAPIMDPEDTEAVNILVEDARKAKTFKKARELLIKGLNAKVMPTDDGFKIEFRSPVTKEYTIFYGHNEHGAQLEKEHPGWWHNMVDAFRRAGMVIR